MRRWLAAIPVVLAVTLGGCGGDTAVHRYPNVDEAQERGSSSGESEPVQRSQPPTDTGGPHPQDELAGEDTEPL